MIDYEAVRVLGDIPAAQAAARGASPALVSEDRTLTYSDLRRRSENMADLLRLASVTAGARVAWLGRNSEHFHVLFFGLAAIGACLTPVNYRLSPKEIAFILNDSGAQTLFVTSDKLSLAAEAIAELANKPRVICCDAASAGVETLASLAAEATTSPAPRVASSEWDLLQLYTSGTTGQPKGVRLTNAGYAAFLRLSPQVEGFDYDSGDVVLCVMPLFHVAGFNVSLMALAHGCETIILDQFSPAEVLRLIETRRVAHVFLAPSMIQMLLAMPNVAEVDFSSLKTIGYGASPIAESTLRQAQATFGCGFVQFYGMTESAAAGTFLAPSAHSSDRLLSCGRPWPETEVMIARPDGSEAPVGDVGEIVIRGPTLMAGYMNRPEATAEAMRGGWLHTGDAGYRDAEGFYFVHDRIKDMIVTGGENVYPAEVEQAIMDCPGVADVAVIGTPSDTWGEEVRALVVLAAGSHPDPAAVIAWAKTRIAGFKAPKTVEFVDALPRNASGKVLRRQLRDPYWQGRERTVG